MLYLFTKIKGHEKIDWFIIDCCNDVTGVNENYSESGYIFIGFNKNKLKVEEKGMYNAGDVVEIKFGDKTSKFEIIEIPKVQTKNMPELIKIL